MADDRLRRLERQAALGDEDAIVRLATELVRTRNEEDLLPILNMLQGLVRRNPTAREVFVAVLPPNAHAFCVHCGKPIVLFTDGFPVDQTGKDSAKGKVFCNECNAHPYRRRRALKHRYCGRCGVVKRTSGHRCTTTLPDWIVGDDTGSTKRPRKHWTNWREVT